MITDVIKNVSVLRQVCITMYGYYAIWGKNQHQEKQSVQEKDHFNFLD